MFAQPSQITAAQVQTYPSGEVTTAENALQHYLHNGDTTYHWEIKNTYDLDESKVYDILLTSQKWRGITWSHQLSIVVPKEIKYDGALLLITGGHIKDGLPEWTNKDDKFMTAAGMVAAKNKAIVAIVRQTPNQPLYGGLTEDELISYTLHQFKIDGDFTWPLLFPM